MMKLMPYLVLVAFLAVLTTSIIYISRKFSWILGFENVSPFYWLFSLIPVYFLTAGIVLTNATGTIGHIFYKIAAVMMGVYLFLVLSFLVIDLIGIFYKFTPINFGIAGIGLAILVSIFGYWNGANTKITPVTIPMSGLTKQVQAVHLTDIHIGHFRTNGFLQKIVDKTNAQNPDIIFLTGDYLDSKYALNKKSFEPLKQLKAPVYFVDGNHDHATHNDSIVALMKQVGVNVLENESDSFGELQIIGLTHMIADRNTFDMHASENNPTIEETLPQLNISKDKPSVLLHHAPNGVKYASEHGVDLYLAGHTHAGQIFPFNLLANLVFDYNRGLHQFENTSMFVSEGVGTFGPPFRIGTKSEIISLTLQPV